MRIDVKLSLGGSGSPTTVVVTGGLGVEAMSEFSQVVMGLHHIVGSEAVYDFRGVAAADDAARATLTIVARKFREFGHHVQPPERDRPELSLV